MRMNNTATVIRFQLPQTSDPCTMVPVCFYNFSFWQINIQFFGCWTLQRRNYTSCAGSDKKKGYISTHLTKPDGVPIHHYMAWCCSRRI